MLSHCRRIVVISLSHSGLKGTELSVLKSQPNSELLVAKLPEPRVVSRQNTPELRVISPPQNLKRSKRLI